MRDDNYQYPDARIVQFAKAPVEGKVKTRLARDVGERKACELYCAMLEKTLAMLCDSKLAAVNLYSDDLGHLFIQRVANENPVSLNLQQGADLGERMCCAIQNTLENHSINYVVLVGSDCLEMDRDYIEQAIKYLAEGADLVLGPATDGGYVLIAMRGCNPKLFEGVVWGGPTVLEQTLKNASDEGLRVMQLATLSDIDRIEDLPAAERAV